MNVKDRYSAAERRVQPGWHRLESTPMVLESGGKEFVMQLIGLRTDGEYFHVNMRFPYELFATAESGNIQRRGTVAQELAKALHQLDEYRTCRCKASRRCRDHRHER